MLPWYLTIDAREERFFVDSAQSDEVGFLNRLLGLHATCAGGAAASRSFLNRQ